MNKNKPIKIVIIALLLLSLMTSCNYNQEYNEVFYDYKSFNVNYDLSEYDLQKINYELAMNTNKEEALDYLIDLAFANQEILENYSIISTGQGEVQAGSLGYVNMQIFSIFIDNDNNWYFQNVIKSYASKPEFLLKMLQSKLDLSLRQYVTDSTVLMQTSNKKNIFLDEEFTCMNCNFEEVPLITEDINNIYSYKEHYNKISGFVINSETVLADDIEINYNENELTYTINCSVNLVDENIKDNATKDNRDMLRETGDLPSLEYNSIMISLEIWNNGTIKQYEIQEKWSADFSLLGTSFIISSNYDFTHKYSYAPEDSNYEEMYIDLSWTEQNN